MTTPGLARMPEPVASLTGMPAFALRTHQESLIADAVRTRLPSGCADDLATRVSDFFASQPDGPGLLVGALPFDRQAVDHVFQPQTVRRTRADGTVAWAGSESPAHHWHLLSAGAPGEYAVAVAQALQRLQREAPLEAGLRKVVLARHIDLEADRPVDMIRLADQLTRDRQATAFNVMLPPDRQRHDGTPIPRHLIGASPELLVSRSGRHVRSCPLAGSARRHRNDREDRAAAAALARSDKDLREHRAAAEAVLDTLAPYCSTLSAGTGPELVATDKLWHLGTPIEGTLKDADTSCAELAAALHPTPAVCGLPREAARQRIHELEPFDRGFYAGAVGWTDAIGDGAWYVSIRCAEVAAERVRLYAGAGIVPGSDPLRETDETAAKFAVMLKALGVDERQLADVLENVA